MHICVASQDFHGNNGTTTATFETGRQRQRRYHAKEREKENRPGEVVWWMMFVAEGVGSARVKEEERRPV